MNLGEFISHRSHCPLCGTALVTGFHSRRKQSISYEDNRVSVSFELDGLNQFQKDYKVAYSFGMNDPSFQIEFYEKGKEDAYHKVAPTFLMDRFKELHKNLKFFKFYRGCPTCSEYAYGSKQFNINLFAGSFEPLEIWVEQFGLSHPIDDYYRCYILTNYLIENRSELIIYKSEGPHHNLDWSHPSQNTTLQLALVPFISKEETVDRLNKLVVFS
jgi:hypothetical protein